MNIFAPKILTKAIVNKSLKLVAKKEELKTPFKVKINQAKNMVQNVEDIGFAENTYSEGNFELQNCVGGAMWYAKNIGKEYDVFDFNKEFYRVNNGLHCGFFFISKKDCVKISHNDNKASKKKAKKN